MSNARLHLHMSGGKGREYKPRSRSDRPVTTPENNSDGAFKEALVKCPEGWRIEPPISSRLWQKSALGRTVENGAIILCSAEALYCHWHRNIALPSSDFVENMLVDDERALHEAVAIETIRAGGEIVMICHSDSPHSELSHDKTWGMRWERTEHPSSGPPTAQVRWFISTDSLDMGEMREWVESVESSGQRAEVVVVDPEYDTTVYLLTRPSPQGTLTPPSMLNEETLSHIRKLFADGSSSPEGRFIHSQEWPLENVGVSQSGGISLDSTEAEWLETHLNGEVQSGDAALLGGLLERGLLARPGFKYGCRWRVYDAKMSEVHAPWLVSTESENPRSWNEACLRARLAAGVNKLWTAIAIDGDDSIFLSMERILLGR